MSTEQNPRGSAYLKTLREAAGLSVQELADAVGVHVNSAKAWERPDNVNEIKQDVEDLLLARIGQQRAAAAAAERLAERDGHLVLRRPLAAATIGRPVHGEQTRELIAVVRALAGRYGIQIEWDDKSE